MLIRSIVALIYTSITSKLTPPGTSLGRPF